MVRKLNIKEPDLSVKIGKVIMKNPVMTASGTFGYGKEYSGFFDIDEIGAVVVKGINMAGSDGNKPPRIVEVTAGLVNSIGLQGPGVKKFIDEYMPFFDKYDVPVIVNIWGKDIDEYVQVASCLMKIPRVSALELNVSCPNVKSGGAAFGTDEKNLSKLIAKVRKVTDITLIVKLAPNVSRIADFARICESEGADAVSLINSYPAMVIDVDRRRPVLANKIGGLSGPAIHPIAVKLVWEAASAVKIPVIGIGGISSVKDALEFIIAGATAVAVGTANFTDPLISLSIIAGIKDYLIRHNMPSIKSLIGSLST